MEKPTRSAVDALAEKGLTVKQIANLYQCSTYRIANIKSRKPQGWREDNEFRNPISPYELELARRVHGLWYITCTRNSQGKGYPGEFGRRARL